MRDNIVPSGVITTGVDEAEVGNGVDVLGVIARNGGAIEIGKEAGAVNETENGEAVAEKELVTIAVQIDAEVAVQKIEILTAIGLVVGTVAVLIESITKNLTIFPKIPSLVQS